jgi:hypothetical protein
MPIFRQRRTFGFFSRGHKRLCSRTAVYKPPNPPPKMHTRGPGCGPRPDVSR